MTTLKLLAVIFLVFGNGFFVAAEFALVGVRRTRVEQLIAEGRRSAFAVKRATDNLDMYLAATQFGITLTSLALGWIGEPAIAHLLEPTFSKVLPASFGTAAAHTVAIVIAFTIITALHIVLGELAPKSLALQRAENVSLLVARPLEMFLTIFRPAIRALNAMGNFVLSLFGLKAASEGSHAVHSAEELKILIESSAKEGALGEEESELIGGVFRLSDLAVRAVMTPRINVAWLDISAPYEHIEKTVAESPFSKLPVVDGSTEKVVGILQKGDFAVGGLPKTAAELRLRLREPLYIPETAPSLKAVETLNSAKQDLAIIVNEFGSTEGLLTMQDLLSAIAQSVREIPQITERRRRPDGSFLLNAMVPIDHLRDALDLTELPEDDSYHTLGGFILKELGRVPRVGEGFEFGGYRFEVSEMVGNRIVHVTVRPRKTAKVGAESEERAE